ncbi:MAG: YggS family pyridoxal phosphate-dependent enzyme [Zoogloeaceae bacterium]|jgi:pyridoxal phosphate enzyme (YggS family)|nr:YggS family pyridoxal phosphate-dependent enzyme [Zoogloeaceae bacterium]
MCLIPANLQAVQQKILAAARACGRSAAEISLLAVSKTRPAAEVLAAARAGQRDFGENYAQEGVDKILALREMLPETRLVWHFIGPLQGNKTRLVAGHFDWVHSIERLKIAQRLSEQRPENLPPLQVLVQVNVSGEASKSGVMPDEAAALCRAIAALPRARLVLRGLMCIPAPAADEAGQRRPCAQLRALWQSLRQEGLPLDTLSMGMSGDLAAAIHEGSTLVRIGTAIFGART